MSETLQKSMTKFEACEDLKKKIFDEIHAPGAWLVERDLSALYGLSRTPIRELLRDLATVGLVEFEPAKGYRVKELRFEEVVEIFNAREAVEGMAARLACQKGGQEFFDGVRRLKDSLEEADIEADVERGLELGRGLHDCMVVAAGNSVLSEVYAKLKCMTALTRNITKKFVAIEEDSKNAHIKIIESVEKRDPDACEQAMREHLRQTCHRLVESYMHVQLGRKG